MSSLQRKDRPGSARRDQFAETDQRSSRLLWAAAVLVIGLGLTAAFAYVGSANRGETSGAPSPLPATTSAVRGDVRLDAAQFNDGQARFYRHLTASGDEVRFFVIRRRHPGGAGYL